MTKVIVGVCSLILRLHMLLTFIKNIHKTLHTNNYLLCDKIISSFACFDWSHASDFRICFWETVAFDFDEKPRQNIAKILCKQPSLSAFCSWSHAFNFRIIFGKWKVAVSAKKLNWKYDSKNSNFDFVLLLFTLLTFSCLYCICQLF